MGASRRVLVLLFVSWLSFCLSTIARAQSQFLDQALAERALGPRWEQLSRRAGMIFAGTVLTAYPATSVTDRAVAGPPPLSVELRFRVDRAIAGVEAGQILTIHEWTGAVSMHRPMIDGQHVLLFLYPPSRLGLTSPVGGSLGLVILDAAGEYVSKKELLRHRGVTVRPGFPVTVSGGTRSVSIVQLERAIRSAREE